MSTEEIYLSILSKPNCSCETAVGFIQDLHRYAAGTVKIIKETSDPVDCNRAVKLKADLLSLLEGYDRLKRGIPNARRR